MPRFRSVALLLLCACGFGFAQEKPFTLALELDPYGRPYLHLFTAAKPITAFLLSGARQSKNSGEEPWYFYQDSAAYYIDWDFPGGGTSSFNLQIDPSLRAPALVAIVFADGTSYGDSDALADISAVRKRVLSYLDTVERMLSAGATVSQINNQLGRLGLEAEFQYRTKPYGEQLRQKEFGAGYFLGNLLSDLNPANPRATSPERVRDVLLEWRRRLQPPVVTPDQPKE